MSAVSSVSNTQFRFKGVTFLWGALLGGRLMQAAAFFMMARYLDSPAMGAVAVLTVLYVGLFQLTNLGFDRYIVYADTHGDADLAATIDTVWTMQILRGLGVLVLSMLLTLVLSYFPEFGVGMGHTIGLATAILVLSFVNPEISSFERNGDFSYSSLSRGYSLASGALITILLVICWQDPWVYIIGQITSAAVMVVLSYCYCQRFPQMRFEAKRLREVFDYGKHLIIIATVSLLSSHGQNIYVGTIFGPAILGSYFTWHRLVNLPGELVNQLQDRLLFAKASDQARQQAHVGQAHLVGFALTMSLLLPFYTYVWFHGDVLMAFVAGERWVPFWWVGKAFILISFFYAVAGTITPFALIKVPHLTSRLRSIEAISGFILLLVLGHFYGLSGVVSAVVAEIAIMAALGVAIFYRHIITCRRLRHARSVFWILTFILVPLLIWETLAAHFLLLGVTAAIASLIGYLVIMLGLAALGLAFRERVLIALT